MFLNVLGCAGSHGIGPPPRHTQTLRASHGAEVEEIFPSDTSHVVILDDRDEMWPARVRDAHLVRVLPYLFFRSDSRSTISLEGSLWVCLGGTPCCDPFRRRSGAHVEEHCPLAGGRQFAPSLAPLHV